MSYLHEAALKKAIGNLYMLGRSDRPRNKTDFGKGAGAGIAGAFSAGMKQQALQKAKAKAATEARQKSELGRRDALVEGEERWQELTEKYDDHHQNVYSPAMGKFSPSWADTPDQDGEPGVADFDPSSGMAHQDVVNRIQSNDIAEHTRMGGRYTPEGLKMIDINSTKNAEDRLKMQSMIGLAGSRRGY